MAVIGIDVGGGSIKGALLDDNNHIIRTCSRPNRINRSSDDMAEDMADIIRELSQGEPVEAAGVGLPGTVDDETGVVVFTPNVGFRQYDLRAVLKERTGVSVRLINDANAAAFAESRVGAGKGAESVVVVTLGTGVGGGVVVDGKIVAGKQNRGNTDGFDIFFHLRIGIFCDHGAGIARHGLLELVQDGGFDGTEADFGILGDIADDVVRSSGGHEEGVDPLVHKILGSEIVIGIHNAHVAVAETGGLKNQKRIGARSREFLADGDDLAFEILQTVNIAFAADNDVHGFGIE